MSNANRKRVGDGFSRIVVGAASTAFFAVYSVVEPDYKYISVWLVMIGAVGTWGLYLSWKRKMDRYGVDLLEKDD